MAPIKDISADSTWGEILEAVKEQIPDLNKV